MNETTQSIHTMDKPIIEIKGGSGTPTKKTARFFTVHSRLVEIIIILPQGQAQCLLQRPLQSEELVASILLCVCVCVCGRSYSSPNAILVLKHCTKVGDGGVLNVPNYHKLSFNFDNLIETPR